VACNLDVVRSCYIRSFVLHKLNGSVPVSCGESRLDSLVEVVGLDEVIDS
jgi:hypothetical protein